MAIRTEGGLTTTSRFAAVVVPLLVLLTAACASGRGAASQPPPDPSSPSPVPGPPGEPSNRFPHSIEAIRQMTLRKGRLGWGGLEVGMTFRQAELVLGRRLPALGSASQDELCGYYQMEAELMRQPLRLEFSAEAGDSHLQALWLPIASRAGAASRDDVVAALHARFPNLEYLPSPHALDLTEEKNPKPLYRIPEGGGMIFVMPGGVYFGEVCVD
jgi:hypothetical protein